MWLRGPLAAEKYEKIDQGQSISFALRGVPHLSPNDHGIERNVSDRKQKIEFRQIFSSLMEQ